MSGTWTSSFASPTRPGRRLRCGAREPGTRRRRSGTTAGRGSPGSEAGRVRRASSRPAGSPWSFTIASPGERSTGRTWRGSSPARAPWPGKGGNCASRRPVTSPPGPACTSSTTMAERRSSSRDIWPTSRWWSARGRWDGTEVAALVPPGSRPFALEASRDLLDIGPPGPLRTAGHALRMRAGIWAEVFSGDGPFTASAFRVLFPARAYMARRYGVSSGSRLIPLLYLWRPVRGAWGFLTGR